MNCEIVVMLFLIAIHFIGGIIGIIICCVDGTMKEAALHGDGIRSSTPSDIITGMLTFWEIALLILITTHIEETIDDGFQNKYKDGGK